jgi:DNA-binding MarR family transcriptional regulator
MAMSKKKRAAAWKTPPPCDPVAAVKKLKHAIPLRSLIGERVRIHVNLHNGCYVIGYRGRVAGYAKSFRLRNVEPKIGLAGWKRCNDTKVRNVHAWLEGELVSLGDKKPRSGWTKVTYHCKTHGPEFYYSVSGKTYEGSAEAVFLNTGKPGLAQALVLVKGKPGRRRNPSCGCRHPGGACSCGAAHSWWQESPAGCGQNPPIRPCGSPAPRVGVHNCGGATLVLDLHNVEAYGPAELKRHGLCPLLAGFRHGRHQISRPGSQHHLGRQGKCPALAALAQRLGVSLQRLEQHLVQEGFAWHAAKAQNPGRGKLWYPPEPTDENFLRLREAVSGLQIDRDPDDRGNTGSDMTVLDFLYGGEVVTSGEAAAEVGVSPSSASRSLRNLLKAGFVEKVPHSNLVGHRQAAITRRNTIFYTITGAGEEKVSVNRIAFHRQAAVATEELSDDAMAALAMEAYDREHARPTLSPSPSAPLPPLPPVPLPPPRRLPPRPSMEVSTQERGRYMLFTAVLNGAWVGQMRMLRGPGDDRDFGGLGFNYAAVSNIMIDPTANRELVVRALYQAASLYARDTLSLRLASSVHRGPDQQGFWGDQVGKGSAAVHTYEGRDMRFARYALREPVPDRLPNPRAKRPGTLYLIRSNCEIPGFTSAGLQRVQHHYVTRYDPATGGFAFTTYRAQAQTFQGLDVAEISLQDLEGTLCQQVGRECKLEIQAQAGGRALRRSCPTPRA